MGPNRITPWNALGLVIVGVVFGGLLAACTLGNARDAATVAPTYAGEAIGAANPALAPLVQLAVAAALKPLQEKLDALESAGLPRDTPLSTSQIFTLLFGGSGAIASLVAVLKANQAHAQGKENGVAIEQMHGTVSAVAGLAGLEASAKVS